MGSKLTQAQLSYLEAAAHRPLSFFDVRHSTSVRCANNLVSLGLLQRNSDAREYSITPAGRAALQSRSTT